MHGEGELLIGVDTKKDPQVLHAAYNDRGGITARFNLNVLDHLNHLLDGDFSTNNFAHVARVSVRQIAAHGNAPRVARVGEIGAHDVFFRENRH